MIFFILLVILLCIVALVLVNRARNNKFARFREGNKQYGLLIFTRSPRHSNRDYSHIQQHQQFSHQQNENTIQMMQYQQMMGFHDKK